MKQFYKKKSFKILIACVIALLLLIVHTALNGSFLLSNLFGLTVPMQTVGAQAADSVSSAAISYDDLKKENEELKKEINELNNRLSDYYDYKNENEELKRYLDLKTENPDLEMIYGSVVQRSTADNYYSFKVNQGSAAGVQLHDPVITEEGLIGWVSNVSLMYCDVTTILSPETNISAVDKVTRDSGVVTGDSVLANDGLVKMSYLDKDNTVKKGDMIVTNGVGGYFPKNLKIGKAVDIQSSDIDVSLYATVLPYANIKDVKSVMIITSFKGQGESIDSGDNSK